ELVIAGISRRWNNVVRHGVRPRWTSAKPPGQIHRPKNATWLMLPRAST
ncbi:hypothetical protein F443_07658, partial [Phytophthora nicotianae P1569]